MTININAELTKRGLTRDHVERSCALSTDRRFVLEALFNGQTISQIADTMKLTRCRVLQQMRNGLKDVARNPGFAQVKRIPRGPTLVVRIESAEVEGCG